MIYIHPGSKMIKKGKNNNYKDQLFHKKWFKHINLYEYTVWVLLKNFIYHDLWLLIIYNFVKYIT